MPHFADMRVGKKTFILFGMIIMIMIVVYMYAIFKMRNMKDEIEEVSKSWFPRAVAVSDINYATSELRRFQLQYAYSVNDSTKRELAKKMIHLFDHINKNLDTYIQLKEISEQKALFSEAERMLFEEFDEEWEHYLDISFQFLELSEKKQIDLAFQLLNGEGYRVFTNFRKDLEALVLVNKQDAYNAANRANKTFARSKDLITLLLIGTIIFSFFLATGFSRYITRPVAELEKATSRVESGDFSAKIDIGCNDEFGRLADAFNKMTNSLLSERDKTQKQAEILQAQAKILRNKNFELEDNAERLAVQNREIEQKHAELKNAMMQLQDAQQQLVMKEKMASLGNLVAGIAHEINNPIGAVSSSTDTNRRALNKIFQLFEDYKTSKKIDVPKLERFLNILMENTKVTVTATQRITKIVKSLKNFARLDEAEFQHADLHEGINSTLTLVHHELKNRIEIVKEFGEIPMIYCAPNELNQVFMNLFVNAAHAIRDKGVLHITTLLEKNQVLIKIKDSGVGIDVENLKKIFDPGFTTKGVGVGTGLGLSISYNIIRKHHGDISVESKRGQGTTFTITLPLLREEDMEQISA